MAYQPLGVPDDPKAIPGFLQGELRRLMKASATPYLQLDVYHKAPDKPREGMIICADGSDWNPGAGAGFYGFSGGVWNSLAPAGNDFAFRNLLINGDMAISQRGVSSGIHGGTHILLDRWTIQQSIASYCDHDAGDAPPGFTHSLSVSGNAQSITSGSYGSIVQRIEPDLLRKNARWFSADAQPLTLQFWVKTTHAGTFGGAIRFSSPLLAAFSFSYTVANANTWELKTVQIPGWTGSWSSWGAGANSCVELDVFNFGTGSFYQTAPGSWNTAAQSGPSANRESISASGARNLANESSWFVKIAGVQLEAGSFATPFERRPYTIERQLCERYYQTIYVTKVVAVIYTSNGDTRADERTIPTPMRATPSISPSSVYKNSISVGQSSVAANTPWVYLIPSIYSVNGRQWLRLDQNGAVGGYPGGGVVVAGLQCDTLFKLSAEL